MSFRSLSSRLTEVERRLDFVMNAIQIGRKAGIIDQRIIKQTLLEVYDQENNKTVQPNG